MEDMRLKVEYVPTDSIRPYSGNAKLHPADQVEQIKASIQEFGFNDPIAVWNDEIVEGHGRLMAAKELGMEQLPIIRLDGLTDAERRGYILAHNQITLSSGFDPDLLAAELEALPEIDMEQFGFEMPEINMPEIDDREASLRRNVFENLTKAQYTGDNYYGIPDMGPTDTTGDKLLRFCDFNQVDDHENYIAHFYYDDYKFINAWREPDLYVEKLKQFKAVISPDFSLYLDFPRALQILSCYRRNWCGAYWREKGIDVIPDVIWGDEESYNYCFMGLPKHSTVAVSAVGVTNDDDWNGKQGDIFRNGYNEMLKRLEPTTVIFYGSEVEGLQGNIIRVPSFYEERRGSLPERKNNG